MCGGSSKSKGLEAFKSYGRGGSFKIQGVIQSQEVGVSVKSQGGGRHLRDRVCVCVCGRIIQEPESEE